MENLPLYLSDDLAGFFLEPVPVESLGRAAELDQEIGGQVLGLDLASFLLPEPEQRPLVVAHDDPGIGTAYK
jgi:hypothetical protein